MEFDLWREEVNENGEVYGIVDIIISTNIYIQIKMSKFLLIIICTAIS